MRCKNTDAVPVKDRCSSWRPSDRYLPYANAECIGTKECDPCKCNGDEEKCDYYETVRKRGSEKKKTTDVFEVVRCEDCEHAYINSFYAQSVVVLCRFWTNQSEGAIQTMPQDGFCSYGERREK